MMQDRERWNARFLAGDAQSGEPDPFLVQGCSGLTPGSALDLAGGAGRHAIWLAQRGWRVVLADISNEGLAIAMRRTAKLGLSLSFRCESATETLAWALSGGIRFDLVAVFWFLLREGFGILPRLLNPGGVLVYRTFTSEHARFSGGTPAGFALDPGELHWAFPSLEPILCRESEGVGEFVGRAGQAASRAPGS